MKLYAGLKGAKRTHVKPQASLLEAWGSHGSWRPENVIFVKIHFLGTVHATTHIQGMRPKYL